MFSHFPDENGKDKSTCGMGLVKKFPKVLQSYKNRCSLAEGEYSFSVFSGSGK
jgi:hypothetical protein